jgi:hypothetical protein
MPYYVAQTVNKIEVQYKPDPTKFARSGFTSAVIETLSATYGFHAGELSLPVPSETLVTSVPSLFMT